MVWIGWEAVIAETERRKGVILVLSQEGGLAWGAGCSPRKRDGRRDEAIMLNRSKSGRYWTGQFYMECICSDWWTVVSSITGGWVVCTW